MNETVFECCVEGKDIRKMLKVIYPVLRKETPPFRG